MKFFIFKVPYLLKMCPIFVSQILVSLTMTLFGEKLLISIRISGLMPNLIKKSWTDSTYSVPIPRPDLEFSTTR